MDIINERLKRLRTEINLKKQLDEGGDTKNTYREAKLRIQNMNEENDLAMKRMDAELLINRQVSGTIEKEYLRERLNANITKILQTNALLRKHELDSVDQISSLDAQTQAQVYGRLAMINQTYENTVALAEKTKQFNIDKSSTASEDVFSQIISKIPGFSQDGLNRFRALAVEVNSWFKDDLTQIAARARIV